MSPITFLELDEGVGPESSHITGPDGHPVENPKADEPGELREQGLPMPVPVHVEGVGIVTDIRVTAIYQAEEISGITMIPARIIPGTRIIETNSDRIAAALLNLPFHVCDPPEGHPLNSTRTQSDNTDGRSKKALIEQAKALGIKTTGMNKQQLEEVLEAHAQHDHAEQAPSGDEGAQHEGAQTESDAAETGDEPQEASA